MAKPHQNQYGRDRHLAQGFPRLSERGVEHYAAEQATDTQVGDVMAWASRIVPIPNQARIAVVGCGPKPQTLKRLLECGYRGVGVEPVGEYVVAARRWLAREDAVIHGAAESIPLEDSSQQMVLLETVLEHVDSLEKTLSEAFRVLAPGGLLYALTVNRYRLSLSGRNPEFNVRFYNWFPALLKEAYVHHHLHFDPSLANFTPRPAVHWPVYSELCALGRRSGFHRFYSKLDVLDLDDPAIARSRLRRFLLNKVRYHPWLRALALVQYGDSIFMLKRGDD